jgi:hypothetical protein
VCEADACVETTAVETEEVEKTRGEEVKEHTAGFNSSVASAKVVVVVVVVVVVQLN